MKARTIGLWVIGVGGVGMLAQGLAMLVAERGRPPLGAQGGLIVLVGCGDGRLIAELGARPDTVVHGLEASQQNVERMRRRLMELGLYGKTSVEQWRGGHLPYADNIVNTLVWTQRGKVPMDEVMHVLTPGGVAYVRQGPKWDKCLKPRRANTDEWTHYLHDASGNAVAHDEVVGPPGILQWTAEPLHLRSHEHTPGFWALVSSGGRIFYICDRGPTSLVAAPSRWMLVARDAYNGILLWERPIDKWYPRLCGWAGTPMHLQRRLVAVGERVYATLGLFLGVTEIDAATGETLRVYEGTEGTEEILYHEGRLLLVARRVTAERVAEHAGLEELAGIRGSPLYKRETARPLVDNFRRTDAQAQVSLLVLDAESGAMLWQKEGVSPRSVTLCAAGENVYYYEGSRVVCVELDSGTERWATPAPLLRMVTGGKVFCADGKAVTVLSAETGEVEWSQTPSLIEIRDAFVAGGSLWLGGFKPYEGPNPDGKRGPAWGPYCVTQYDLSTGEVLRQVEPENPGHHHRCWSNKATDRYILGGRRGTEFIDLSTGEVLWHSWARGVCRYGVMPANGLLYVPPHACGCYVVAKLMGFNALAPRRPEILVPPPSPSVERGPAYEAATTKPGSQETEAWPTYRHDVERSGRTPASVPTHLHELWRRKVGGKLTAPVVAEGRILLGSVDCHTVIGSDEKTGEVKWCFTIGGRVDSAPTLQAGQVLFGGRDGYLYSVRLRDGVLAWRVRVAREDRRIVANGQLESSTPVIGSVLVREETAYCTAGRSSYLDGGIDLCRVDARTGKLLSRTSLYSPDPQTGRQPPHIAPGVMPGVRADILSADDQYIYLRENVFDPAGNSVEGGRAHLFTLTDFLDDSWAHRSYWIFGTQPSLATGCSGRERNLTYGRLLVFDESTVYGYGRRTVHWSDQLEDGAYRLYAKERSEEGTVRWERAVPLHVRAMVMAGDVLFIAGPVTEPGLQYGPADMSGSAILMAISAGDGSELARYELDNSPIFDGMAAAEGRLYLTTTEGDVVCMG
ncbi:MAG: outer membrane protein assembly factor BamB family protein [Candidatus Zipacnadales bacterium]